MCLYNIDIKNLPEPGQPGRYIFQPTPTYTTYQLNGSEMVQYFRLNEKLNKYVYKVCT